MIFDEQFMFRRQFDFRDIIHSNQTESFHLDSITMCFTWFYGASSFTFTL